ncbi:MAG: hypothetical protein JXB07_13450 [Anaerolineae bacterium]|nr:hypothetical protein [Anaerolineae bacterium]
MSMIARIARRFRAECMLYPALLILAISIWLVVLRTFSVDDSFITYRYARNVATGLGLVYNPGEKVLSTTAPLYALLLAVMSLAIPDLPLLGRLVSTISIGLGGAVLVTLLPTSFRWLRVWSGIAYVLAAPLWLALGMETSLWIGLVMGAIGLARNKNRAGSGALIGLATLTRPDAALPGILLGLTVLAASRYGSTWQKALRSGGIYALAAITPVVLFYGWVWITYGSPAPVTLSAKQAQATLGITGFSVGTGVYEGLGRIITSLLRHSLLYALFGLLMVGGVIHTGISAVNKRAYFYPPTDKAEHLQQIFPALLLVIWGISHLLAYAVMDIAPYRWYYAPLLPGAIVLATVGLKLLLGKGLPFRHLLAVAIALPITIGQISSLVAISGHIKNGYSSDPGLLVVNWTVYREAGEWLNANTPPEAVIGVAEVGQLGFYAQRTMTDNLGLLQPETAAALKRRDVLAWLPAQLPDYLVFQRFREERLLIYNISLADNPWFHASYRPVAEFDDPRYACGPVTIFERVSVTNPLTESVAGIDFGPLRLDNMATDGRDLQLSGREIPIRVRLDWTQIGPMPDAIQIVVTPLNVENTTPADTVYMTGEWTGQFSTWHTLLLNAPSIPGGMPLLLEVSAVDDRTFGVQAIGWLDISFPKDEAPDPKAPTFCRDQSAQLQLAKHSVSAEGDQITMHLAWYAAQSINADYTYFVHLRREGEESPAAQSDGVPLDGHYPTYLWEAGEIVPLEITLTAPTNTPGQYRLTTGWYTPGDGKRLSLCASEPLTVDSDSLLLADVVISEDGSITITPLMITPK